MNPPELRTRYLDLMRNCLIGMIYEDPPLEISVEGGLRPFDRVAREIGMDWPSRAHSMIGQRRMLQLQRAAEFVIERGVAGDFIETGVWRGGACIMLRAVLKA
jgi:O-methyltransferase